MKNYIAIDQHGLTEHNLGQYPRKELLHRYATTHADKMYVDNKTKGALHIGWIIAGHWFTVYSIERMEKSA
jgi:hypothetical protein